ncbi:MAG: peptidylprolyl isomerase [Bacteroidota bacterium]
MTLAITAACGCGGESPEAGAYVARVGDRYLTDEELARARDSAGARALDSRAYIEQWVVSELLFQEAGRRGLAGTPDLERRLTSIRRRLAVEALLAEEWTSADSAQVPEEAVRELFDRTPGEFLLREDVVRVSSVLFRDRDPAALFRSRLLQGTPWEAAVLEAARDSLLVRASSRAWHTRASLYPEELWKLARSLSPEEVSFVLRTQFGYYVLLLHRSASRGERADLDYVRDEIRDRLMMERRQALYDRLVRRLGSRGDVELRLGRSDTARMREGTP